jgi:hypothetical protein
MAFDSRNYEWNDMSLNLGGKDQVEILEVKYTEKQEKELSYAKGNQPHSIQKGNFSYEGSLKVTQAGYETLVEAGKGSVLKLEVDAVVSYGNPSNGDAVVTDKIQSLQFTEADKNFKQGDKRMEVELPFVFLRLQNHVS